MGIENGIEQSTMRIEPQKTGIESSNMRIELPNTEIEPWMNQFFSPSKNWHLTIFYMGIETSFHQQKGHMDIGATFQEPNYLTAKMVACSSPDFSLSWMVVSLSSIYSIQFENV